MVISYAIAELFERRKASRCVIKTILIKVNFPVSAPHRLFVPRKTKDLVATIRITLSCRHSIASEEVVLSNIEKYSFNSL